MPKKKKDQPKGKPGPKRIEIDYDEVAFFCREQIKDAQLARKLRISPQVLSLRLKKDPKLREAREGGKADGQSILYSAAFRKALDRYLTICKDCGKHRMSFEGFLESCPYCDKIAPDEAPHTNVKHKFVPAATDVLIFLCKNHLGMSDKITHEGNADKPMAFTSLAEFSLAAAQAHERKKQKAKAKDEGEGESEADSAKQG
jgi:hypothetical protein